MLAPRELGRAPRESLSYLSSGFLSAFLRSQLVSNRDVLQDTEF